MNIVCCLTSKNDRSFFDRFYENQNEGTFILYNNEVYKVQVGPNIYIYASFGSPKALG